MSLSATVWSAVISAGVSGVVVFCFQQWIQHRVKGIERELDRQRVYQQGAHERLVAAYTKIWTGLVEIEDWLKRRLWSEITQSGEVLDPNQWSVVFDTYRSFRGEMLFLPDPLYERTRGLISELEQNLNGVLDAVQRVLAAKQTDPHGYSTNPELLALVNASLTRVNTDYRITLEELRTDYQAISRDILLGEIAPVPALDRAAV